MKLPLPKPSSSKTPKGHSRWATLLARTFAIDVMSCPNCGGRMRLKALVNNPDQVRRFLTHQGRWFDVPTTAPARAPPQRELAFEKDPPFDDDIAG